MAETALRIFESPLPYSVEAESGVIGSALVDAERVLDLCIERQIIPDAFYDRKLRLLYETILDMHHELEVIDLVTVAERLKQKKIFKDIGGSTLLRELVDATPTSAHAEHYIRIVADKHLLRRIIDQSRLAIERCNDSEEDASLIMAETEQAFFGISEGKVDPLSWSRLMDDTVREVNRLFDDQEGLTGIATGFSDVDRLLLGMQRKDMIIIAARPSMGKTSLALNIVEYVAMGDSHNNHPGKPVAVFSLEMGAEQLVRRMLCSHAEVSFPDLVRGKISAHRHQDIMNAASLLKDLPIYIDDTAGLEVLDLRARARRLKRRFDIQFFVVDYLQLLNYSKFSTEGRQRETAAISNQLKAMAKELDVPVMVLSQLSRAPETRERNAVPRLSDLRDSGSIEQDADVVGLLRRPCKYPSDPEALDETLSILDIAKHRNGAVAEIRLNFLDKYTRFQTRDERHTQDQLPDL